MRGVVSWSSVRNGSSRRRRKRRPKPSSPSYQSWLPGTPRSDPLLRARADLPELLVPRQDEALVDLVGRRHRIGDVATEDEDVPARQAYALAVVVRSADVVGRGQHRADLRAHVPVVARYRPRSRSSNGRPSSLDEAVEDRVARVGEAPAPACASSSSGGLGRIQSRESTDSVAIARATKLRRCPKSEVIAVPADPERRMGALAEDERLRRSPRGSRGTGGPEEGRARRRAELVLVLGRLWGVPLILEQHVEEDSVFELPWAGLMTISATPRRSCPALFLAPRSSSNRGERRAAKREGQDHGLPRSSSPKSTPRARSPTRGAGASRRLPSRPQFRTLSARPFTGHLSRGHDEREPGKARVPHDRDWRPRLPTTIVVTPNTSLVFKNFDPFKHRVYVINGKGERVFAADDLQPNAVRTWAAQGQDSIRFATAIRN